MNYEKDLEKTASNYHLNIISGWEGLYSKMRKELFSRLSRYFKGNHVLELGCGDGEMTLLLADSFKSVTVVDGSETMLNECKIRLENKNNIEYHKSYFEDYKSDKKFDVIIMSHVLEHLDNPVQVLQKISSLLKEDGVLLIAVPNADSIHRQVAVEMNLIPTCDSLNEQDLLLGHRRVYTLDGLKQHCLEAKYSIIDFGGLMLKPLTNRQIEEQWSEDMVEGFIKLGDKFPHLSAEIFVVLKK
ncbi:class I SAM-dependent methyltransferase [Psychrobacillus sp. NPDC096623]|uniref:class I SAM-dependent methyltransferase n=1 Tax=Psychrobacillus sp. NPDC096623 TaxID=3364492 RepID=UPI003823B52A